MNTKESVDQFLAQKSIALVGLSRKGNQFSNSAFKELKKKGYNMIPVNPNAESIDGEQCYPDLNSLKDKVDGALIMTPSNQAPDVVKSASDAGIKHVWIQQGAESEEAARIAEENKLNVVSGECIMMFAQPTASIHRFHRWVWKLFGKLPE